MWCNTLVAKNKYTVMVLLCVDRFICIYIFSSPLYLKVSFYLRLSAACFLYRFVYLSFFCGVYNEGISRWLSTAEDGEKKDMWVDRSPKVYESGDVLCGRYRRHSTLAGIEKQKSKKCVQQNKERNFEKKSG